MFGLILVTNVSDGLGALDGFFTTFRLLMHTLVSIYLRGLGFLTIFLIYFEEQIYRLFVRGLIDGGN